MTDRELLELAEQAGMSYLKFISQEQMEVVELFLELIRKDEREACAKEAEHWQTISSEHKCGEYIASAIRARSNHE